MLIGIRKRGFIRRHADPEVNQLAHTTSEPIANIPQRICVSQLAEQHSHQLRPATEAFGRTLRPMLFHQSREFQHREVLQ